MRKRKTQGQWACLALQGDAQPPRRCHTVPVPCTVCASLWVVPGEPKPDGNASLLGQRKGDAALGTAQAAGEGKVQILCEQQAQFHSNPRGGTARLPCLFVLPALSVLPALFALPALPALTLPAIPRTPDRPQPAKGIGVPSPSPKGKDQTPAAASDTPALLQIQTSSPHTMLGMR